MSCIPSPPNPAGSKALSWISLSAQTVPAVSWAAVLGHSSDRSLCLFSAFLLFLLTAVQPSPCWGLPGASFSSQLNFSQHKTSEAFRPLIKPVCVWVQWAPQEPEAKQWSRWRWERGWETQTPSHRIFSDLWSHAFCHPCSSMVFCPAELPGSASTSLPV